MRMIRSIMKYIFIKYLFDASDINLILYKWLNIDYFEWSNLYYFDLG